jgi:hypothetical protein
MGDICNRLIRRRLSRAKCDCVRKRFIAKERIRKRFIANELLPKDEKPGCGAAGPFFLISDSILAGLGKMPAKKVRRQD